MSSTQKRPKLDVQSQTSNWSKVFPSKLETEAKSLQFVKKLVTLTVSNITYLRNIFPEDAYANRSLDKLPLKILKQNNPHKNAATLASWLLGAFDAIEKKYLKEMMLVVYLDAERPDVVHEMYTFKLSYPGGLATCEIAVQQGGDGTNISVDSVKKSTQSLLRRILVVTQSLSPIPSSGHVSMKLTYYDSVTPVDYQPAGFVSTEMVIPSLPVSVQSIHSGKVATNHHTVQLKVLAMDPAIHNSMVPENEALSPLCKVGQVEDELVHSQDVEHSSETFHNEHSSLAPKCPRNDVSKSAQDVKQSITVVQSQGEVERPSLLAPSSQLDEHLAPLTKSALDDVEPSSVSAKCSDKSLSISPSVLCSCNNSLTDPLMLSCSYCSMLQHAACYRILDEDKIPNTHCCVQCSQEGEDRVCTDTKLVTMAAKQDVTATCFFRRILAFLTVNEQITAGSVMDRFGINEENADVVIGKLKSMNILLETDNQAMVMKPALVLALRKYLGILTKLEGHEVQHTTKTDIAFGVSEELTEAGGSTAAGDGDGLRMKSVAAETEITDGGRKRKKASSTVGELRV